VVPVCWIITVSPLYTTLPVVVVFVMLCLQGDALVVCWLRDVHSVLELRSLKTGDLVRDIPLPDIGSVSSFKGDRKSSEAFFSFTTFTDPGSDFRCGF
jgi:prolyl oligopeptidase